MSHERRTLDAVPNPFTPNLHDSIAFQSAASAEGTVANGAPTANLALYIPCTFPRPLTLVALQFVGGNTTGNYDIGFYAPDLSAVARKGSTAAAVAVYSLSLGNYRVTPGKTYYAACVANNTASRFRGYNALVTDFMAASGYAAEASALPLPANMTPVTLTGGSQTQLPFFNFTIVDTV